MTEPFWTPERKTEYKKLLERRAKRRKYHREFNRKQRAQGKIPNWRDIIKLKQIGIDTKGLNKAKAKKLVRKYNA